MCTLLQQVEYYYYHNAFSMLVPLNVIFVFVFPVEFRLNAEGGRVSFKIVIGNPSLNISAIIALFCIMHPSIVCDYSNIVHTGATIVNSALFVAVVILVILFVISRTRLQQHKGKPNCVPCVQLHMHQQ